MHYPRPCSIEGHAEGIYAERINAIRTAISAGLSKETIISALKYTEDEYETALK